MATSRISAANRIVNEKNNAHIGSGSEILRRAMQGRTVATAVPHLAPILDKLPASAVVLEVGSGPGGITLDIAKHYPHLRVYGVDIDDASLKLAEDALQAAGISNLKYKKGDAVNLSALMSCPGFEFIVGGCDLVYTHASICHMPNQIQAIKHLRDACKPGATLAMAEGDAGLFFSWPPMPKMLSAFPMLGAAKGADLNVGRKLLAYSRKAGFTLDEVQSVSLSASTSYTQQHRAGIWHGFSEMFRDLWRDPELIKESDLAEDDLGIICKELEDWSSADGAMISFPSVTVIVKRTSTELSNFSHTTSC